MSQVLRERWVSTRKPHRCTGCGGIIPTNSRAHYSVGMNCGDFWHCYTCEVCDAFINSKHFSWRNHEDGIDGDLLEYPEYDLFKLQFTLTRKLETLE